MNPERAIAYRKQASGLIEAVINEEISPRAALNCWPMAGNEDPSVQCAYTMLWYFEADEDRHKEEEYYADLQIKTLLETAQCLKRGEVLPHALIKEYATALAPSEYAASWTWREPWLWFKHGWAFLKQIIETNPWVTHPVSRRKSKSPLKK